MTMKQSGKHYKKMNLKRIPAYIPIIFWTILVFAIFIWIFCASFASTADIFRGNVYQFPRELHFENYLKALFSNNLVAYFLNSFLYCGVACVLIIVIAAPASYALAKFCFRLNSFFQALFVAGMSIPVIMVVMPLYSFIAGADLLNNRVIVIVLYIGLVLPFSVFYLISFFSNLPSALEEAAAIDGCSAVKAFWLIMFPLAKPGIISVTIFNFITLWNDFFVSLLFAQDSAVRPVSVGLYYMVESMRYVSDYGSLFAAVFLVFIPTVIVYIFFSNKIVGGVTSGSVKG